ncbi:MAG: OB-fold nucleic acid binding domain-containing protein, partial [Chakrabartia sp.]
YIYARYGRHRAGIVATVIHYRPRSAVRDIGKALGLTEDVTQRLSSTIWGSHASTLDARRFAETGFDPDNPEIARLNHFVQQILRFPRHLSQHVGGFVLTEDRLDETVPLHNAAMAGRTFIEWDKDDIDALGLMKVDILALGMLSCIRKAFTMIDDLRRARGEQHPPLTLSTLPDRDEGVFDMLCRGDSIGVFQVESRAQMNMLPRMRPRNFYDLAIQVAIVRPGPIQGDMVHPYLRRRQGREPVAFPSPAAPHDRHELREVLGKTLGVPLFQEQAMKLAIVAAEFTPSEANQLRRAMATFRNIGTINAFRDKLIRGMVARGYEAEFAERCFRQIEGFGSYGFPESHAIAFARLVWISAWIKHHQPAVFAAALLNAQPMGFYAPAQIVRDARNHGVPVDAVEVNASLWDNQVRVGTDGQTRLQLGFRQISGFRQDWADAIVAARPFVRLEDLARRAALPQRALQLLADADALRSLGLDRRAGLWEARRLPEGELPLFAAARARELAAEPDMTLPDMTLGEHVVADYQTLRLSLKDHPMALLRPIFSAEKILSCEELARAKAGARVAVAGLVLVRQRPGNGKAIFITLEDETGVANIILWARTFEAQRPAVMASRLMQVSGEVQRSPEGIVHLLGQRVTPRNDEIARLSSAQLLAPPPGRGDSFAHPVYPRMSHPRDVRTIPKSRDFH